MIQSLWDGMLAKVDELIAWVKTIPQRIRDAITTDLTGAIRGLLPASLGGGGAETPVDGARATGGPVSAGGTYLVGEEGPELFRPGRGGSIVPNDETMGMLRQSSASTGNAGTSPEIVSPTLNLGGVSITGVQDIRGSIDEIERLLNDRFRDFLRSLHRN